MAPIAVTLKFTFNSHTSGILARISYDMFMLEWENVCGMSAVMYI